MKKYVLITAAIICLMQAPCVSASCRMYLDGKPVASEIDPLVEEGCALLPLGVILSEMGVDASWDPDTMTVTASKGCTWFKIQAGQRLAFLNDDVVYLDAPVRLVGGRLMVPSGFIYQALGVKSTLLTLNPDSGLIILRNPILASKIALNHDTFRHTRWGQTLEDVARTEEAWPSDSSEASLIYSGMEFCGLKSDLGYYFINNCLALAFFDFNTEAMEDSDRLQAYDQLTTAIGEGYGEAGLSVNQWRNHPGVNSVDGNVDLFNAWVDEYTLVCLFLNKNSNNLGLVYADIDQLDNALTSLFGG